MREMITLLDSSLPTLQERASIHEHAKLNGKGSRRHP